MTVKAIYREGNFVPEAPVDIPDGAEVELTIARPTAIPPEVTDPEERQRIIDDILADMARHPWPADAPRFTREELHERR
jgi:predicted DNA-binding antitoxin AbrB/MazE fold protein